MSHDLPMPIAYVAQRHEFFYTTKDFWKQEGDESTFSGVPTAGATVGTNSVLVYPARNGKQLRLKFSEASTAEMT